MSWIQNGKNRKPEKPVSGCLGRMVNLFDLNTGVAGNKLLTDKPHHDGKVFLHFLLYLVIFLWDNWLWNLSIHTPIQRLCCNDKMFSKRECHYEHEAYPIMSLNLSIWKLCYVWQNVTLNRFCILEEALRCIEDEFDW